eukprot:TRINITY_DN5899_c2_g1_i1.p1 TRINITY_DN5899_c2_g1~~TRINITY_DN5899_c2_g1_i1.p1  ORF type:complete len:357 (+),score=118.22 TRINITY_DN5899_c2_g1_i1:84-1073(+)
MAAAAVASAAAADITQRSLPPWQRHQELMQRLREMRDAAPRSDWDVLRDEYRFIRSGGDLDESDWGRRLACAYYRKLYKEYALVNLVHAGDGRVGMRWRTEKEVVAGVGQFRCGGLLPEQCGQRRGLTTFEVPFRYKEQGEVKDALVKVRLCPVCAELLPRKGRRELLKEQRRAAAAAPPQRSGSPPPRWADARACGGPCPPGPKSDGRRRRRRSSSSSSGRARAARRRCRSRSGGPTEREAAAGRSAADTPPRRGSGRSQRRERSSSRPRRRGGPPCGESAPRAEGEGGSRGGAAARAEAERDHWRQPTAREPTQAEEFDAFLDELFP